MGLQAARDRPTSIKAQSDPLTKTGGDYRIPFKSHLQSRISISNVFDHVLEYGKTYTSRKTMNTKNKITGIKQDNTLLSCKTKTIRTKISTEQHNYSQFYENRLTTTYK